MVLICRWPKASYRVLSIVAGAMPNREAVTRSITRDTASPPNCWSVATSSRSGNCFNRSTKRLVQSVQLVGIGVFEGILVLGAAHPIIYGDVLHRLHEQLYSLNPLQFGFQPADQV